MTMVAKALKHQPSITVYHDTFFEPRTPEVKPIKGYRLVIGNESVFLPEEEADNMARYMLFNEDEASRKAEITDQLKSSTFGPAYSEPSKE